MASTVVRPEHLSYPEARERVLGGVKPLTAERVPLADTRGRALRRVVRAEHDLPPFTNSSMDGFAVRAADLEGATSGSPIQLPVVEVIAAGRVASRPLGAREAMRIMTGASMPPGADTVVPFEDTVSEPSTSKTARFDRAPMDGANVRLAGEDLRSGEEALADGRELSPHDIALLAALGVAHVEVGRRPRVALISTGDELLRIDEPLRPGAIRDSNLPLLRALLEETGCSVIRSEQVTDRPEDVANRLLQALKVADVVLSVGGVSAGDFDPVKQSIGSIAGAALWRVAMKPGRPQAFGMPEGRLFYGLPGNPASVACVFEALVRPALRKMQGFSQLDRPRIEVRAGVAIESRQGRTDFVRATLEWRNGEWRAVPAGPQVSGHVATQARAHVLLVVPEDRASLAEGDRAEALLLRWPDRPAA